AEGWGAEVGCVPELGRGRLEHRPACRGGPGATRERGGVGGAAARGGGGGGHPVSLRSGWSPPSPTCPPPLVLRAIPRPRAGRTRRRCCCGRSRGRRRACETTGAGRPVRGDRRGSRLGARVPVRRRDEPGPPRRAGPSLEWPMFGS